jgi:hypothetical protein
VLVPSSDANIVYVVNLREDGSALHNGTGISMPNADVNINITNTQDCVIFNQSALFEIKTNQTQNTSLAFVYPDELLLAGNMDIIANDTKIEYSVYSWDDLLTSFFPNESEIVEAYWNYTTINANFACFEMSLIANSTIFIGVYSNYEFTMYHIPTVEGRDSWEFHYIFGSARTFDGDTLERIHIHVTEEVAFSYKSFRPAENLTVLENGLQTDAIWEFYVSQMEGSCITFTFDTPFIVTDPIFGIYNPFPLWIGTICIAAIVTILVLYRIRYRVEVSESGVI